MYIIEFYKNKKWTNFFEIVGKNPLFIYMFSEILLITMLTVHVKDGTTLFSLCFRLGPCETQGNIIITDGFANIEIGNGDGDAVPFDFNDINVTVGECDTMTPPTLSFGNTNISRQ